MDPDPADAHPRATATVDPTDPHERLAHLRGALRLTGTGVELAADLAEDVHRAIAAAPLAVAGPTTRALHDELRGGIYAGIRRINRLLFRTLDRALELGGPALAPPTPLPSPLVGLLHGVLGDHLNRDRNPLRTAMQLRHGGRRLAPTRAALAAALPHAGDRVVLFVHGLAADETCWRRGSQRAWGQDDLDYGRLLADRCGVTPLYLRYNSGLRIADNGRALAALLRRLVAAYPAPLRQLVLVGHSMGGLVVRSACHHGRRAGERWTDLVRDVVCLGAPHRGAVLEKFGAVAVRALAAVPVTAPIARAIDLRSAGIKDLRDGNIRDDAGDEATLAHARYHDLAAVLGRAGRPLAWLLGDGLVRVPSATPDDAPHVRRKRLERLGHVALLNDPAVLAWLESILHEPA